MGHTEDEIEAAASRFERPADELGPGTAEVELAEGPRAIAAVSEAVRADEARLREAVELVRAHGRSWNQVAVALGVSRQAARQRFTDKTHPGRQDAHRGIGGRPGSVRLAPADGGCS